MKKNKRFIEIGGLLLWLGSTVGYTIYSTAKKNNELKKEIDSESYTLEDLKRGYDNSKKQD